MKRLLAALKQQARALARQALVAWYAARDPRTPWSLRLLALFIAGYAMSPIDLIPDFIPVLGMLDDLIIIPLGLALIFRFLPKNILADARAQAADRVAKPVSRVAAQVIVFIWVLTAGLISIWFYRQLVVTG